MNLFFLDKESLIWSTIYQFFLYRMPSSLDEFTLVEKYILSVKKKTMIQ